MRCVQCRHLSCKARNESGPTGIMGIENPVPGSEAGERQFKHEAVASAYGSRRREHTKTFGFDRRWPVLVCASAGRTKNNTTKHWFKGLALGMVGLAVPFSPGTPLRG